MNTYSFFELGYSILNRFFYLFMSLYLMMAGGCSSKDTYNAVEFTGTKYIGNYSRLGFWNQFIDDSLKSPAILCGKNDLLVCDDFFMVYHHEFPWQQKNNLSYNDSVALINENIVSVHITSEVDLIPWFKSMDKKDLSHLQNIYLASEPKAEYYPYLEKLSAIRPDVGLILTEDLIDPEYPTEDYLDHFKILNPRYLIGFYYSAGKKQLLEKFKNLELLWIMVTQEEHTEPLPALPKLKQLFLTLSTEEGLPDDFFIHNRQIEKLIIIGADSREFDFKCIRHLKKLKVFSVLNMDSLINFQLINNHPHLESLNLCQCHNTGQINLAHLRWITFPPEVTQEQFDNFLNTHPRLEVVEINNRNITDLHHLSDLHKLKGLVVADTVTDFASIKSLNHLAFFSLPAYYLSNTSLMTELHQALPDTRVVANEGLCMGSGWLLLLVPIILAFRMIDKFNF